jgi:hypothetical protein
MHEAQQAHYYVCIHSKVNMHASLIDVVGTICKYCDDVGDHHAGQGSRCRPSHWLYQSR